MSEWHQTDDPASVAELLAASDRASVGADAEVPRRNPASTALSVEAGWVWMLREQGINVAMITISPQWTGSADYLDFFPPTNEPRYMRRLAVHPDLHGTGSLLSMRAIRKAIEVAEADDATAIRCETNPHHIGAVGVLKALGFARCGPELGNPPHSTIFLARDLDC